MRAERMSYEVMTPSAAVGILEAILWKPEMRWDVQCIHVLKPIRMQSIARNEIQVGIKPSQVVAALKAGDPSSLLCDVGEVRTPRSSVILTNVGYVIEADIVVPPGFDRHARAMKYQAMFERRSSTGQCFHRPCLGIREYPAEFALLQPHDRLPSCELDRGDLGRDLGLMLHGIDFPRVGSEGRPTPRFFRGRISRDGCVAVAGQRIFG